MDAVKEMPAAGTMDTVKPAPAEAARPAERTEAARPVERTRRTRPGAYDKAGMSFAYMASGVLSIALWYAGAYFTIAALRFFGVNTSNPAWWLLPAAITAIEIWLMPRAGVRWQAVAFFAAVLVVDVLSSWYGVTATLGGRFLPLGAGYTVPDSGTALHVSAVVISLIFAFMPERLARWSVSELLKLWGAR